MEKIIDLSGFKVDASDYAETFANFSKWYQNKEEAVAFLDETTEYIRELVKSGEAKFFCCDGFHGPIGYLPMVRCKHVDCEAYNEDGEFEGLDENNLKIVDAYSCVKDISLCFTRGGMLVKVQLILTYFSEKNINTSDSQKTEIATYGAFNEF